ncbi:hypothetical protein ACOSQ2_031541 [Xanthoceras sorbifolium]
MLLELPAEYTVGFPISASEPTGTVLKNHIRKLQKFQRQVYTNLQLYRLHRDHTSRYPGRDGGRVAHCQDCHFFIASQSSRSVVAVTSRGAHCQESTFFIASSASRSVVAMARSRCSLSQFFTLSSCIVFDRSIWSTWKP